MMYNARYLQPRPRTGADTILHLKTYVPLAVASTVFDYSLNNHPGTLKGTAALKYPGCDLDGDSDYIEVADHADFSPILTPYSIRAWVNMHAASRFPIVSKSTSGNREWIIEVGADDKIYWYVRDNSAAAYIGRSVSSALTGYENTWLRVAGTYDGGILCSGLKIYLDGTQSDDADYKTGTFVSVENLSADVWIGREGAVHADGLIDDVIISKKELTATEVRSDFETTRSRYGV